MGIYLHTATTLTDKKMLISPTKSGPWSPMTVMYRSKNIRDRHVPSLDWNDREHANEHSILLLNVKLGQGETIAQSFSQSLTTTTGAVAHHHHRHCTFLAPEMDTNTYKYVEDSVAYISTTSNEIIRYEEELKTTLDLLRTGWMYLEKIHGLNGLMVPDYSGPYAKVFKTTTEAYLPRSGANLDYYILQCPKPLQLVPGETKEIPLDLAFDIPPTLCVKITGFPGSRVVLRWSDTLFSRSNKPISVTISNQSDYLINLGPGVNVAVIRIYVNEHRLQMM